MNDLISIVIPTRNEEENIEQLVETIAATKMPRQFEIIVVDDSNDNTAKIASEIGCRVIEGKGQGLGQAIIDGIAATQGALVVIMDADLSHRPEDLPLLLKPLLEEGYDMVIGSRYVKSGKSIEWSLKRRIVSRVACLLALPITGVKDATSGFFAFKKSILEGGN